MSTSESINRGDGRCDHGRGLFDVVNAPDGWNEEMGYGADQAGTPPFPVTVPAIAWKVTLERSSGFDPSR